MQKASCRIGGAFLMSIVCCISSVLPRSPELSANTSPYWDNTAYNCSSCYWVSSPLANCTACNCHKSCLLISDKFISVVALLSPTPATNIESTPTKCAVTTLVSLWMVIGSEDKHYILMGMTRWSTLFRESTIEGATKINGLRESKTRSTIMVPGPVGPCSTSLISISIEPGIHNYIIR